MRTYQLGDVMASTCDPASARGLFYIPEPTVRLDGRVYQYLSGKAHRRGVPLEALVNDLLKKSIELSWKLEA
jgi:hypothetical protein